jgi:L-threonylcarbamoyladenylate synthase
VLLRPGSIGARDLESVLGRPLAPAGANAPRAPGTLPKHYAPATPLMLVETDLLIELAASMARQGQKVAVLARSARQPIGPGVAWIAAPSDAAGYAHDLYANLRTLDRAGCGAILVEQPPLEAEWTAVQDRLMRAAAGSSPPDAT